jgi:hypothetical protein
MGLYDGVLAGTLDWIGLVELTDLELNCRAPAFVLIEPSLRRFGSLKKAVSLTDCAKFYFW